MTSNVKTFTWIVHIPNYSVNKNLFASTWEAETRKLWIWRTGVLDMISETVIFTVIIGTCDGSLVMGLCHHSMARPRVAGGRDGPQI
jgi:hypothetical protein